MDLQNIINLSLIGILVLFLLAGTFWGIIRGLKKTIFRSVWLIVFAVVLLFVTPIITNTIIQINFSGLQIIVNDIPLTTLKEFLTELLISFGDIGALVAANPNLMKVVEALPALIVNPIMFLALFWATKIGFWIIWAILSKIFIPTKNRKTKEKLPKHRAWGALVGCLTGFIICSVTLMPTFGLMGIAGKIEQINNPQTNTGIITSFAGEEAAEAIEAYNNSITGSILTYTGLGFVNQGMFNYLTTVNINGTKINLENDLTNLVEAGFMFQSFSNINLETLTKEELELKLNDATTLINKLFNVKLLTYVGDEIMPSLINEILNNSEFSIKIPETEIKEVNAAIKEMLQSISTETFTSLKEDLLAIVELFKALNKHDILLPVLQQSTNMNEIIKNISANAVVEVSNALFNIPKLTLFTPILINNALIYAGNNFGFDVVNPDPSNINKEQIKKTFESIFTGAINLYKEVLNNPEGNIQLTESLITNTGLVLNAIVTSPLVSDETVTNVLKFAENKLIEQVNKLEIVESFKTAINTAIAKLSEVENLLEDFKTIASIVEPAMEFAKSISNNANITEIKFNEFGTILDALNKTYLFNGSINELFASAMDMVAESLTPSKPEDTNELTKALTELVLNTKENAKNVSSWENELTIIGNAIKNAAPMLDEFENIGDAFRSDKADIYFGKTLDIATQSVLITKQNINKFFESIITNFSETLPETAKKYVPTIIENVKEVSSWQEELGSFKNVFLLNFDNLELSTAGNILDDLSSSKIMGNVLNLFVADVLNEEIEGMDESEIKNIMLKVCNNIRNNQFISYAKEFENIKILTNELGKFENSESVSEILNTMGASLDALHESKILSNVRVDILDYAINYAKNNLNESLKNNPSILDLFNKLSENTANITELLNSSNAADMERAKTIFATEFEHLNSILTLTEKATGENIVETLTEIGTTLDTLQENSLLFENCGSIILELAFEQTYKTETNESVKEIINTLKENARTAIENGTTFETILSELAQVCLNVNNVLTNLSGAISETQITDLETFIYTIKEFNTVGNNLTKQIFVLTLNQTKESLLKQETDENKKNVINDAMQELTNKFGEESEVTNEDYAEAFSALKSLINA